MAKKKTKKVVEDRQEMTYGDFYRLHRTPRLPSAADVMDEIMKISEARDGSQIDLPVSINGLVRTLGVVRKTAKRAIDALIEDGFIIQDDLNLGGTPTYNINTDVITVEVKQPAAEEADIPQAEEPDIMPSEDELVYAEFDE